MDKKPRLLEVAVPKNAEAEKLLESLKTEQIYVTRGTVFHRNGSQLECLGTVYEYLLRLAKEAENRGGELTE